MNTNPGQDKYWDQEERIRGKTLDLLRLLKDRQWHSNYDCFQAGGLSFQGRLCALRKLGFRILSRYVKPGHWDYQFVGWQKPVPKPPTLSKPQRRTLGDLEEAIVAVWGREGLQRVQAELPDLYRDSSEKTGQPQDKADQ